MQPSAIVIINEYSGGYTQAVRQKIAAALSAYLVTYVDIDDDVARSVRDADLLVVAGGDGTLSSVFNKLGAVRPPVLYVPCGTLNERAKARKRFAGHEGLVLGQAADRLFAYVLAAGTFTPIGYVADVRAKKRFGRLAYFAEVLREYRVHAIPAVLSADSVEYAGDYTLIMVVKCDRCFGFRFNRMYVPESLGGHLLLVKSPRSKGLSGKIRIFFPFFRAFFLGFRHEYHSSYVDFISFDSLTISLSSPVDFDVDGEKVTLSGAVAVSFTPYPAPFTVLDE